VLKLPKVPQYPTKGSTDVKTVECDICDEGAKLAAIKFCMDCYKKMCDSHAQVTKVICVSAHCRTGGKK
jgi:hypothetical protein